MSLSVTPTLTPFSGPSGVPLRLPLLSLRQCVCLLPATSRGTLHVEYSVTMGLQDGSVTSSVATGRTWDREGPKVSNSLGKGLYVSLIVGGNCSLVFLFFAVRLEDTPLVDYSKQASPTGHVPWQLLPHLSPTLRGAWKDEVSVDAVEDHPFQDRGPLAFLYPVFLLVLPSGDVRLSLRRRVFA